MDQIWVALIGATVAPLVAAIAARWSRRDLAQLRELARDPDIHPTIRGEARVALLNELNGGAGPHIYLASLILTGSLALLAIAEVFLYDGLHLTHIGGLSLLDVAVCVALALFVAAFAPLAHRTLRSAQDRADHLKCIAQVRAAANLATHPTRHPDTDDETRHDT